MEAANQSEDHKLSNTDLAFERTVLAENRTLMAWIRTAISLISFGFTIYKFFHEVSEKHGPTRLLLTSREVGMLMITLGLLTLTWGLMEHRRVIKKLKKSYPAIEPSKSTWLALSILVFGLGLFLAALFRQ
ncbi:YidH family protein [Flavitalea antarctica]